MKTIEATYRIVTPMFIGGANPNAGAELRPPTIKAALRFWYRSVDAEYRDNEARLFGGVEKSSGQSLFLLTVDPLLKGRIAWNKNRYQGLSEVEVRADAPEHASKKDESWTRNGLVYLGFSLAMGNNRRKAIEPGKEFTVYLRFRKDLDDMNQRRIAASLWLMGHLGGLGSRSRRGFGTVALRSWRWPERWNDHERLPIAHGVDTVEDWSDRFEEGLKTLRAWFPEAPQQDHTVISGGRFYLFEKGYEKAQKTLRGKHGSEQVTYQPWEMAMDAAGKAMQGFRQRWNLSDQSSDYFRVKQHLMALDPNTPAKNDLNRRQLTGSAPARVAFGLPLTFRYSSLQYQDDRDKKVTPSITFQGQRHDRSASPVWIRIIEIGGTCHPLFAMLKSPLLPADERIVGARGASRPLARPDSRILEKFAEKELKPSAKEVLW